MTERGMPRPRGCAEPLEPAVPCGCRRVVQPTRVHTPIVSRSKVRKTPLHDYAYTRTIRRCFSDTFSPSRPPFWRPLCPTLRPIRQTGDSRMVAKWRGIGPEMAPKSIRITCRIPGAIREVTLGGYPTGEVWPYGRIGPSATAHGVRGEETPRYTYR